MRSILNLPEAVAKLSPTRRNRFDTIFRASRSEGSMTIPAEMRSWVKKQFGSIAKVERQEILRVTNHRLHEGTLFNALRASRPMHVEPVDTDALLEQTQKEPFRNPETMTPEDTFGRVHGASEITASNVAKYDANHGLVIFNNPNPLAVTRRETLHHYETAEAWLVAMRREHDEEFGVIAWNCLWKAGASLVHGHMQVLLSEPYAHAELLRSAALGYRRKFKKPYFDALYAIHEDLGLATTVDGHRCFASITPRKEKEVVILSDSMNGLSDRVYGTIQAYRKLGVASFNVATILPPWRGFPIITRLVDRGALGAKTTDIGVMELFLGHNVVASDPVKVWKAVKSKL